MKRTLLMVVALCFVGAGSFEAYSQKSTVASKKPVKRKLVKCRVNGKVVYRARCGTKTQPAPNATLQTPVVEERYSQKTPGESDGPGTGTGQGAGLGNGSGNGNTEKSVTADTESKVKPKSTLLTRDVQILSKPAAVYTDKARQNMVQGNVLLRVSFLANGKIGAITPVSGLADGLTDQAIEAAKKIRFEPATRNGKPYSQTKIVSYSFTIY